MPERRRDANESIPLVRWHMKGFHEQCLERYKELRLKNKAPISKMKEYAFPSIDDHQIPPEEFEQEGVLSKDASKVVMKCLYGARFVRFDLLWPIGDLARKVSKWTKACDRRLDRLMGYLQSTLDHGLEGFVGDAPQDCQVLAYCDASFADELATSKSTSGFFIAIVGPNTYMPINSFAKKQTAVSHSTTESEMVALEEGLRSEALQVLTFWEHAIQLFSEPTTDSAGDGGLGATDALRKGKKASYGCASATPDTVTDERYPGEETRARAGQVSPVLDVNDSSDNSPRKHPWRTRTSRRTRSTST